jgi:uncharacterized protein
MAGAIARIRQAIVTVPDRSCWRRLLLEAAWSLPLACLLCAAGGLIRFGLADDPALLLRLGLIAILAPAFGEELLFRALMLPPPGQAAGWWRYALPVALFVAWHPPQVLLFGADWGEVVLNGWFLAAVAVMGIAFTRLYLATGSIWPSTLLHWVSVVSWKGLLGGPSPWVS